MQHNYRITVRPDGKWQGCREHGSMPLFLADTQQEAEEIMCEIARRMGNTQVMSFGTQGEVLWDQAFATAMVDAEAPPRQSVAGSAATPPVLHGTDAQQGAQNLVSSSSDGHPTDPAQH